MDRVPDSVPADTGAPVYRFRPSMIGSALELRLTPDFLVWTMGNSSGRIAYPMIVRMRLGYRPSGFSTRRYVAELWPRGGTRIAIYSTSPRNIFDIEDHGADYRAFVRELSRRIAAARADCCFETGYPAWRWWPMAAIGAVTLGAVVYVGVQAVVAKERAAAAMIAAFGALFFWQIAMVILRNRPGNFAPDAIPENVLPKR